MVAAGISLAPSAPRSRSISGGAVIAVIAGAVLLVVVLLAIAPALFATADPLQTDPRNVLQPPGNGHPMGTDQLGRDVYSRVVYGARSSIVLGIGATLVALAGGLVIGVTAGLSRGAVDRVLSRGLDIVFAFPDLLIAIVAVAILGTGLPTLLVAIGIGAIPGYARILRSQVKVVRGAGYVEASVALGKPVSYVVARRVLPNSVGPLLVLATIGVGTAIIAGAALSFVGLGATPPTPEWGLMLAESRNYLSLAPWLGVWPGVFLAATVVAVNVVGRHLQRTFVSGAHR